MVVDSVQQQNMSFKDKLLGGSGASDRDLECSFGKNEGDFELVEGDVNTSMVDGIWTISFSDRNKDILFKEMELTIILKLLGRIIGYNDFDDYNRVLTQGPWIIFGQYLTVQPWTQTFNPAQPYPSMVMA
ncbi:hypothetical protein GOBAR_AA16128 [Gossypium barbadense]|uniref:DUF4283 domain-containing protein n=1 Tax=Gossypium barbadense TaxID=3634 RepID=A0A2P5XME2_GOSBA|nr:hypothetical protein GOBAR_AA16128 [Gossypium barbadense]